MIKLPTRGISIFLAFFLIAVGMQAQSDDKNNVAVRFVAPNYIALLDNIPSPLEAGESFGGGLEFEYQRRFAPNFLLGIPLRLTSADAIRDDNVSLTGTTINEARDVAGLTAIGADALLVFEPIARRSFFDPQLFAGIGAYTEIFDDFVPVLPLGVNLNFNLGSDIYLSPNASYRLALSDTDVRDNLQLGLGLHIPLDPAAPKLPPQPVITDTDGDGLADNADQCPTEAGPASTLGCPDTDGDGIADKDDDCPEVAGLTQFKGCADTDGDGVPDPTDKCPDQAGPEANDGCPIADSDGDGTPDAEDQCPDQPGVLSLLGCPDSDGDGVADKDDDCPNAAGPSANRGCPDTDGDGVMDKDDSCPTVAGPASNRGCPEITQEDQETIDFAIQNINFETASATITAESRSVLDRVEDILRRYPGYKLAIGGHTDSIGSAEANMSLSERRAKSVYDYLIAKGISANRMTYQGFGETLPIADNRYKDGREQNRRVTLDLSIE